MWTLAVSRSPFPCSQLSGLQLETKQNIKKSADSTNIWQKAQSFQTSISKMVDQNFVKHTIFWKKATRSIEMYLDEVPKLTWILGDVRPLVKENHFCTLKIVTEEQKNIQISLLFSSLQAQMVRNIQFCTWKLSIESQYS